jgi:hypothetical protein
MQPAWGLSKRSARKPDGFVRPHAAQENGSLETNAFRSPVAMAYTYRGPARASLIFLRNNAPPAILGRARPLKILRLVKFALIPPPALLGPIASHSTARGFATSLNGFDGAVPNPIRKKPPVESEAQLRPE